MLILVFKASLTTQGHEVEFHEIKIHFFMRSKLNLLMRLNLLINIWQCQSGGQIFDHEIEIQKSIIRNFNLMIVLAANKLIMRSKFKINLRIYLRVSQKILDKIFGLKSKNTTWLICGPPNRSKYSLKKMYFVCCSIDYYKQTRILLT